MISESYRGDLNNALRLVASKLGLDKTRYQNAEEKYQAIGNWLNVENSSLARYSPQIYSQGSFLLGTVVKPLSGDEYDIDLVCLLSGISPDTRPQKVKGLVGDRLKESSQYSKIIEEKNRCWRLHYAREFHMDIIPAIPDTQKREDAILVPDRELTGWAWSNPKGYAAWFQGRMQALAEIREKGVEEVPDYSVKTVLQLAVQLMKRHRDIVFEKDPDNKPISIIITTLAARVYEGYGLQEDLFEALKIMAANMPDQIVDKNGELWVTNPVNPDENFADKWPEHPERQDAFYLWIEKLQDDLSQLESISSLDKCKEFISIRFGESIVLSMNKDISLESKITVGTNPFEVEHKKSMEWGYVPKYDVTIRAKKKSGVTKGVMPKEFHNNSSHLSKGLSLEYTAITNTPGDYDIQWQVVNTGSEAERANQLRGEFYPSSGANKSGFYRKESTRYTGMHWVEAFVVKDKVCVARSDEFVIYIK